MTDTPCSIGNPDDWFIEKDGRQYRDEPVLDDAILSDIRHSVPVDLAFEDFEAEYERLVDLAEAEALRQGQIRRRKAREACFECPVRLACLDKRLETKLEYGTWGGYFPEDLKVLDDEMARRERRRLGVD